MRALLVDQVRRLLVQVRMWRGSGRGGRGRLSLHSGCRQLVWRARGRLRITQMVGMKRLMLGAHELRVLVWLMLVLMVIGLH